MYISFAALPSQARIWIYQSDKILSDHDKTIIYNTLKAFTQQWMVHGQPMDASFEVLYDRFIILAANDQASGCAIDSSVRAIKEIGEKTNVDFFARNLIAFKKSDVVFSIPVSELKSGYEEGSWSGSSQVFNTLITTKADLDTKWIIKASESWLKRYLPQETLSQ